MSSEILSIPCDKEEIDIPKFDMGFVFSGAGILVLGLSLLIICGVTSVFCEETISPD